MFMSPIILYTALHVWCHQSLTEGKIELPQVAVDDLPNAGQDAVDLCCKGAFLAHGQLVQEDTQVLFYKAAFQTVRPQPVLLHGFIPPQVQDFLPLLLLNFLIFLLVHFSSQSKILWMAAQSSIISATLPSLSSSENLVGVYSVSSSGTLTKYLWPQKSNPGIHHLVTEVQTVPLISILWAQQFSQFPIHAIVYSSNSYFISLLMRVLSVLKASLKTQNIHCFLKIVTASQEMFVLVKPDFPFVSLSWWHPVTF